MHKPSSGTFPDIRFRGTLRPSQAQVVEIAQRKLAEGKRRLHIVAPPGSGKTVLGLFLWAECVKRPALVLSPNSAIQAQWAARTDLFDHSLTPQETLVSTNPRQPALLTSLTYQSVTLPSRGDGDLDLRAHELWQTRLIEDEQAQDLHEAQVWIEDLQRHNRSYYQERLSAYRKQVRDATAIGGRAMETLHPSSLETLRRLREQQVEMIVLDECHHLLGHWGRVLADAHPWLESPVVVGLTATPPDRGGKKQEDTERYDRFFGGIDFEVPVPAVVKDGFLAPYQDLAYFVRPTTEELSFIANVDHQLHQLVDQLCQPRSPQPDPTATEVPVEDHVESPDLETQLPDQNESPDPLQAEAEPVETPPGNLIEWLTDVLTNFRLPTGTVKDWHSFQRRDTVFADAARQFLAWRNLPLPEETPPLDHDLMGDEETSPVEFVVPVLDRYIRHHLRRSRDAADHQLAETAIRRLRMLGVQITEVGSQACSSPVSRVLAYSQSKSAALLEILKAERRCLEDRLRAVVVTDYEKTSAVETEINHLLDSEAGGAIAAFRTLLSDPETDLLNPILITGSSVLVDDDVLGAFQQQAEDWLNQRGLQVSLSSEASDGFFVINGRGSDWCPRVYVRMITDLFQQGLTQCLVGTRGLLGEGWDANKVNVLIDLTTATTSMTVNQLRGRSIRLDPDDPEKLANNWDVVCIAPEFSKGLDDYGRFMKKHKNLYGVTDDGAIEMGVGHVHPAFTEMRPEGLEDSIQLINEEMLQRVNRRSWVRDLWRIGQPYQEEPVRAVECKPIGDMALDFPPFAEKKEPWKSGTLATAVGEAVLRSLCEAGLLPHRRTIHVGERAGGYVRLFLEEATEEENHLFSAAMREALGPLRRPRYVIPRHVDRKVATWLSSILPSIVGRYFEKRKRVQVMLHAVPSQLAKKKELVEIYQRYWNRLVSPGEAVYAHRSEGQQLIEAAVGNKQTPRRNAAYEQDVFL